MRSPFVNIMPVDVVLVVMREFALFCSIKQ
jgi:translation initiation factor IF-1